MSVVLQSLLQRTPTWRMFWSAIFTQNPHFERWENLQFSPDLVHGNICSWFTETFAGNLHMWWQEFILSYKIVNCPIHPLIFSALGLPICFLTEVSSLPIIRGDVRKPFNSLRKKNIPIPHSTKELIQIPWHHSNTQWVFVHHFPPHQSHQSHQSHRSHQNQNSLTKLSLSKPGNLPGIIKKLRDCPRPRHLDITVFRRSTRWVCRWVRRTASASSGWMEPSMAPGRRWSWPKNWGIEPTKKKEIPLI